MISLIHDGQTYLPWVPSTTLYKEILKYQRIYLSSHVIYGSSRLGTKDYLPGQIYSLVDYTQAQPVADSVNLLGRRPWYSNQYQDDIIYTHTEPWQATQTGMFSAGERIGEKQYELTNHLGNVMATVSDNKVGNYNGKGNLELAGWHPALRAAYDYYPFGMLMPDRYISDTTQHCVTVSQPHWAWKLVLIGCVDQYKLVWPKLQLFGAAQDSVGDNGVLLTALSPGDGMSFELSVTPDVENEIHFEINRLDMAKNASIQILETNGSEQTVLAAVPIKDAEGLVIRFKTHSGKVKFVLLGPIKVWVRRICAWHMDWVEEDQLVTICDGDKDKYRWGYIGGEKINEIMGIGNYVDLGERGSDTRTGRLNWRPDPLEHKFPYQSPYAYAGNNPIFYIDKNGEFKINYTEELKELGLTKVDVTRFENIVANIYNLVENNPQALDAIVNTTGFNLEEIKSDFQKGNGPQINILKKYGNMAAGYKSGIYIDVRMIKNLASIDGSDKTNLSEQTLGMALTILHEYGHYGDQTNNYGSNTGQYKEETIATPTGTSTKRKYESEGFDPDAVKEGTQRWRTTLTGHRGNDIEVMGFGLYFSVDPNGKSIKEKGKLSPTTPREYHDQVPTSLPKEAKGDNILNTLNVK